MWQYSQKFNCLPYPGGLVDQPDKIITAFGIFTQAQQRVQTENEK